SPRARSSGSMASIRVVFPLPERPAMPNTRVMGITEPCEESRAGVCGRRRTRSCEEDGGCALTARLRHDPDDAPGGGDELVALGLDGDAGEYQAFEFGVVGAPAQGGAQRHLVFLAQAQIQGAVDAQADAVAAGTEVPRHGGDDAQRGLPGVIGPI